MTKNKDWIDDESLSDPEKLEKFDSLEYAPVVRKVTPEIIYYEVSTALDDYEMSVEEFVETHRWDLPDAYLQDLSLMYKDIVLEYLKERNEKRDKLVSIYTEKETWGWHWIVEDVHKKLLHLDPYYTVQQVKEKFGGLRYYFEPTDDARENQNGVLYEIMNDVVRNAEYLAYHTCMYCGNSSAMQDTQRGVKWDSTVKLHTDGWYRTLCDTCEEERLNKRN